MIYNKMCVLQIESVPEDAEALLSKNLESAEQNLKQIGFDLDYLRDQMTNTEVRGYRSVYF